MRIDRLLALVNSVDYSDFPSFSESNKLTNLKRFRPLVLRLAEAEEFQSFLAPVIASRIFETDRDEFHSEETYKVVTPAVTRLHLLLQMLPKVLAVHANEPNEFSVLFRLPDPADLKAALTDLETFQIALEQLIVNPQINGNIRLDSWEKGSFWVDLYLGSGLAVSVIGSVAWAAAVVRKKTLEGDLIARKIEGLEIENQALDALRKGLKKNVQAVTDVEARSILDKYYEGGDQAEQLERIKFSIRTFAELIHRGAEIHPALYAPEEVKNLFPDPAKLAAVASKIKQLEDIKLEVGPTDVAHS